MGRGSPLVLAVMTALAAAACGDTLRDDDPTPPDVVFQAGASGDAWLAIAETMVLVDDTRAPILTEPAPRLEVSPEPPTFRWTPGTVATSAPSRPRRSPAVDPMRRLLDLVDPVCSAYAQSPPPSGPMYRLTMSMSGSPPVRVLTGTTSYVPSGDAWARITSASGPVTIEIVGAYVSAGRVTEGPYRTSESPSITFE